MGKFVPQGLVPIAGEEAYKQMSRNQNEYIDLLTAIRIQGLHKDAMWADISINGKKMTLNYYLNQGNPHIKRMLKTKQTEEEGRWSM
eukprot:14058588-Ditylum_brightwellii.AAC.1